MFNKILIANRGEIACRVIETAQKLGVATVAVYSDFDASARHVELADEAVHIGAAPAAESYLDIDTVIAAAKSSGAEAIHPGYGFLSENAAFAGACSDAGLVFIGPPPEAIEVMGSKQASKQLMEGAAVPLIPGYHDSDESDERLTEAAASIGFPLMIKASAGGGGKGMRRVDDARDFASNLAAARREASAAFGDDRILLEKMLVDARHVEVQVFADNHGAAVHLFERDCSLQRRHQKVIEEAPAPNLAAETRAAMGQAAVAAARAVNYRGAGTVEFIMDAEQNFFFMEMNTRLQVEHPVTEMITGIDLVEWQLRVAANEALPKTQAQLSQTGWSVEARLYAENPAKRFLPATGTLEHLKFPKQTADLRIETGVRQDDRIGIYYDPMIAKIVAWASTREAAIARLDRALGETQICGLVTNLSFLQVLLRDPNFVNGTAHTQYLDAELDDLLTHLPAANDRILAVAALAEYQYRAQQFADLDSPWCSAGGWRSMTQERLRIALAAGSDRYVAELEASANQFSISINGGSAQHFELLPASSQLSQRISFKEQGRLSQASYARTAKGDLALFHAGTTHSLKVEADYSANTASQTQGGAMTAPMPGNVVAVLAKVGDKVRAGDPLVVIEAMKMEHKILATKSGSITALPYVPGDAVEEQAVLVEIG